MVTHFIKNYKIRLQFQNFELQQKILKALVFNTHLSVITRRKLSWQYSRICFLSSLVFIKNRCILSGRYRSVYRFFNLSRLVLKEFFKLKYIPFLTKSS